MMTKLYLPGHIKTELMGDLVSIITKGDREYDPSLLRLNDPKVLYLTGVRIFSYPPVRIYFGINHSAGEEIRRRVKTLPLRGEVEGFRDIDRFVITPQSLEAGEITLRNQYLIDPQSGD